MMDDLVRKEIEKTYTGTCDIYQVSKVKDPLTKITSSEWSKVNLQAIPCGISFSSTSTTVRTGDASEKKQEIKLFVAPELSILPGSKLIITQNGVTSTYQNSGVPAVYGTHQEINLEIFGERA